MAQLPPKQWSQQQVEYFMNGAMSILTALDSTFKSSPLLTVDGQKQQEIVDGRKDTPIRFARMMMEMLEGELYTDDEIVDLYKDKVFVERTNHKVECLWEDIKGFSFCEHHIALMYDITISISIDYDNIENDNIKVVGLSKIPRICDLVCKRLQLQERITTSIHYIISKLLGVPVIVTVRGKHSCVSARGIKKDITFTSTINSTDNKNT